MEPSWYSRRTAAHRKAPCVKITLDNAISTVHPPVYANPMPMGFMFIYRHGPSGGV